MLATTGACLLRPKAIDFIVYGVTDLDASVAFYRDILGLPVDDWTGRGNWAEIPIIPVTLCLTTVHRYASPGAAGATLGIAVDDVDASTEELRAKGVAVVVEPFEAGSCRMAQIADPDDNRLWLHRRNDGTFG